MRAANLENLGDASHRAICLIISLNSGRAPLCCSLPRPGALLPRAHTDTHARGAHQPHSRAQQLQRRPAPVRPVSSVSRCQMSQNPATHPSHSDPVDVFLTHLLFTASPRARTTPSPSSTTSRPLRPLLCCPSSYFYFRSRAYPAAVPTPNWTTNLDACPARPPPPPTPTAAVSRARRNARSPPQTRPSRTRLGATRTAGRTTRAILRRTSPIPMQASTNQKSNCRLSLPASRTTILVAPLCRP